MTNINASILLAFLFFNMSAFAQEMPRKIEVIRDGKTLTRLDVPLGTRMDVSADTLTQLNDNKQADFKGKARLFATFPTGEQIGIRADEVLITSDPEGK